MASTVNLVKMSELEICFPGDGHLSNLPDISLSPLQLGHTAKVPKPPRAWFFLRRLGLRVAQVSLI